MSRPRSCVAAVLGTVMLLSLVDAHADLVWSSGSTPGAGWALETAPSDLSRSASGTGSFGESGSAYGAVSLSGGFIKARVESFSTPVQSGFAQSRVGLSSVIDLSGPGSSGGTVAVTMTFDGLWGGPGDNVTWMQLQSGPGGDFVGFAGGDPALRGLLRFEDNAIYGKSVPSCINCTYDVTDYFVVSVTTFLPFAAGQTSVQFAAQIELFTQGGFIDGSNTALFSIVVPEGFSYSSQLAFTTPPLTTVPEPQTYALLSIGVAAVGLVASRRRKTSGRITA